MASRFALASSTPSAMITWMVGQTMHIRRTAFVHRFVYPVLMLRLRIDQTLPNTWWFGHNRHRLVSVFDRDHADGKSDLKKWIKQQIDDFLPSSFEYGHIDLITQPRILGYVFNPVSFWMIHNRHQQLCAVLCEVNNTFGVRLSYLLHHQDFRPIDAKHTLHADKHLHVSPFFSTTGHYRFTFDDQCQRTHIHIHYQPQDPNTPSSFDATLTLFPQRFDGLNTAKLLSTFGMSSLMVMLKIHWQAFQLWRKGAVFHRSPPPPKHEVHHESTP